MEDTNSITENGGGRQSKHIGLGIGYPAVHKFGTSGWDTVEHLKIKVCTAVEHGIILQYEDIKCICVSVPRISRLDPNHLLLLSTVV